MNNIKSSHTPGQLLPLKALIIVCLLIVFATGKGLAWPQNPSSTETPGVNAAFSLVKNAATASGGTIWDFRDNYTPQRFYPTPEYMVFVDLGVLILIMLTGLYLVTKKKPAAKLSLLALLTLLYLGVVRGGCICPVGAVTNISMGVLQPERMGLVTLAIFLSPLVIALIAGRVFCTAGCPLGAIQHLLYKKKHIRLPATLNRYIRLVPAGILLATIYLAIRGGCYLACELDPYKPVFFTGQAWFEQLVALFRGRPMESRLLLTFAWTAWIYLIAVLVVGYWVPRPFCRLLCPYGVLLGIFSLFGIRQRRISHTECTHCGLCELVCPVQAITVDRKGKKSSLSMYDCIQCNKCSDRCKRQAQI